MTTQPMQERRDTAANWTSLNPVPLNAQWCYETDTKKAKLGDGVTPWTSLPYFTSGVTSVNGTGPDSSGNVDLPAAALARVDGPAAAGAGTAYDSGNNSNGTDTGTNSRAAYTAVADMGLLEVVYMNGPIGSEGEAIPAGNGSQVPATPGWPVTVTAAIEYPAGSIIPLTFGGNIAAAVSYFGRVTSDPVGIFIPAGATFWVRTFCTVTSGNEWWSAGWAPGGYTASGGTSQSDLTQAGTISGSYSPAFLPVAVRGKAVDPATLRIAAFGDSITAGYGDTGTLGWFGRAFTGHRFLRLAQFGERITYNNSYETLHSHRLAIANGCNAGFAMYGTNDFRNPYAPSVFEPFLMQLFRQMRAQGMAACYACTIPPVTASTDNWASAGGQTVTANESYRTGFNQWLRANMPLNPSTLAPVAVGTGGALLAGHAGHPVTRVYDLCSACETSQDSGLWKTNGTAFAFTQDGIHPSVAGYTAMAALINVSVILADLGVSG